MHTPSRRPRIKSSCALPCNRDDLRNIVRYRWQCLNTCARTECDRTYFNFVDSGEQRDHKSYKLRFPIAVHSYLTEKRNVKRERSGESRNRVQTLREKERAGEGGKTCLYTQCLDALFWLHISLSLCVTHSVCIKAGGIERRRRETHSESARGARGEKK